MQQPQEKKKAKQFYSAPPILIKQNRHVSVNKASKSITKSFFDFHYKSRAFHTKPDRLNQPSCTPHISQLDQPLTF